MKRILLQSFALALLATTAYALDTAVLLSHDPAASEQLAKNGIRLSTSGLIPLRFDAAAAILGRPDLYRIVQDEYARSVSRTGNVDFPIIETAPRHYRYVDEKGKRTDIAELYRRQTAPGVYDVVVMASGKRVLGSFDAIIHLKVLDAASAGSVYVAEIHAYPRNGPLRFMARRFGIAEHRFRKSAGDILRVSRRIAEGLADRAAFNAAPAPPAPAAIAYPGHPGRRAS